MNSVPVIDQIIIDTLFNMQYKVKIHAVCTQVPAFVCVRFCSHCFVTHFCMLVINALVAKACLLCFKTI